MNQSCGMLTCIALISAPLAWVVVFTVFFDGEAYGYVAEVGETTLTEKQAEAAVSNSRAVHKMHARFLEEVRLKVLH